MKTIIALILLCAATAGANRNDHNVTCIDDAGNPVNVECSEGDTTLVCPAAVACPSVTIASRVVKCAKVKTLPSGSVVGRNCLLVTEAQ